MAGVGPVGTSQQEKHSAMFRLTLILLLAVVLAVVAGALGVIAWRLTCQEERLREGEAVRAVERQARSVAEACRRQLDAELRELAQQLRQAAQANLLDELTDRQPLLREVFVTTAAGQPLHPAPDAAFWLRYQGLFAPTEQVTTEAAAAVPDSRFSREVREGESGWITWYTDNRLRPLFWVRLRDPEPLIIGGELDVTELLTRMNPLLPPPEAASFALADVSDAGVEATVAVDIDPGLLPNHRVLGYLDQASVALTTGRSWAGHLVRLVSLLAGLFGGGLLLVLLVIRQVQAADRQLHLAAALAEELAVPLGEIRRRAQQLSDQAVVADSRRRNDCLSRLLIESDRLSRMVGKVVDFSRLEERRQHYVPAEFDLGEMLRELAELWHPELSEAGLELKLEIPQDRIVVTADREAVVRALWHLLDNALEYAASGREVTLSATRSPDGETLVRVMDRGPGVPLAMRDRIFREFCRGEIRPATKTSSTGLGLAIARRLMREQGGDLTCHPRPGGGAEFRLALPD